MAEKASLGQRKPDVGKLERALRDHDLEGKGSPAGLLLSPGDALGEGQTVSQAVLRPLLSQHRDTPLDMGGSVVGVLRN